MKKKYFFLVISLLVVLTTIHAFAGVNPDGSFSTSVPIILPPGTNGMQPNISLEYNSNNGNGMLGMGWQLSGIPYITRDVSYPIYYKGDDEYCGPNGHLVKVGDYWHYENETFSQFQMIGENIVDSTGAVIGIEPQQWIETKPDGTKYYYGDTEDSRIEAFDLSDRRYEVLSKNRFHTWALSKVEDVYGNSYIVEYYKHQIITSKYNEATIKKPNSAFYHKKIIYSMGDNISKYRIVEFDYDREFREDCRINLSKRVPVYVSWLLKSIVIKTGVTQILGGTFFGDMVRYYTLEFEKSTVKLSRLKKITEYGSGGGVFQSTSFDWQEDDPVLFQNPIDITISSGMSAAQWNAANNQIFTGDFNNDGFLDILLQPKAVAGSPTLLFFNKTGGIIKKLTIPIDEFKWGSDEWLLHSGDFNGDGGSDFLLQRKQRIVNNFEVSAVLAKSMGNGFIYENVSGIFENLIHIKKTKIPDGPQPPKPGTYTGPCNPDLWYDLYHKLYVGDFNGDGISDLLLQPKTVNDSSLLVLFDKTFKTVVSDITDKHGMHSAAWSTNNSSGNPKNNLIIGDFNGDGNSDIIIQEPETATILLSNKNNIDNLFYNVTWLNASNYIADGIP